MIIMKSLLSHLKPEDLSIITQIGQLADQLGFHAYLVGGPVRDLALKSPNTDLDITVEGNAFLLAESFAKLHEKAKIIKYPAFKTATVSLASRFLVDFATARKESYAKPGAYPKVVPSTIKDDLTP
jgi:tRNA nucleotidyltransferase (CCA-adding enzyme)